MLFVMWKASIALYRCLLRISCALLDRFDVEKANNLLITRGLSVCETASKDEVCVLIGTDNYYKFVTGKWDKSAGEEQEEEEEVEEPEDLDTGEKFGGRYICGRYDN